MGLKNNEQVANVLKVDRSNLDDWIDDYEMRKSSLDYKGKTQPTHTIIRATKGFPEEERKS